MTGGRALAIGCGVAAIVAARSWVLPASAPAWLRGTSPFTWTETRAEKKRCEAFASMIGSTHPATYYYGENRSAPAVVQIQRTVRAGDSLACEGQVTRGNRVNYVFHCATANVRGHPGEHRSEMSEPWGNAKEWPAVRAIEARLERACADSAVAFYPTSRISPRMLMLRTVPGRGHLLATAVDSAGDATPQPVSCWVSVDGYGQPDWVHVEDPATGQ